MTFAVTTDDTIGIDAEDLVELLLTGPDIEMDVAVRLGRTIMRESLLVANRGGSNNITCEYACDAFVSLVRRPTEDEETEVDDLTLRITAPPWLAELDAILEGTVSEFVLRNLVGEGSAEGCCIEEALRMAESERENAEDREVDAKRDRERWGG